MSFFAELRKHADDMNSQFLGEIRAFIAHVEKKYENFTIHKVEAPQDAAGTGTDSVVAESASTPVSDAPVAEASAADDSAVPADVGSDDSGEAPAVAVLSDNAPAVSDEPAVVTPAA